MTNRQKRQFAMLVRLDGERKQLFEEGSEGAAAFNVIGSVLAQIGAFNGAKQTKGREIRDTKRLAKQALVAQLVAIARSAQVMAKRVPDAAAKFPLPKGESDVAVQQAGLLFLKEAAAMKDAFIKCGLPATFLDTLQQGVTAFEQAIAARSEARVGAVVSRKEITTLLKEGIDAARSLDVLIANRLGHDRVAMAVWKQKRHVDKVGVVAAAPDASASAEAGQPALEAPEPALEKAS